MATLAAGFGALVSLVRVFKEIDMKIVSAMFLGAGVCMLIAVSIYTSKNIDFVNNSSRVSWGWSYIIGWIGTILAFVCTAFASILK